MTKKIDRSLSPMDLNQGDLLGSVFAEVDSVELVAEVDSVELVAEVDSVVLFRHSSSSSTAMTHLQLKVRKPNLQKRSILCGFKGKRTTCKQQ